MALSKKYYKVVAQAIAQEVVEAKVQPDGEILLDGKFACGRLFTASNIAKELALVFSLDNPRFDPTKFFEACGLKEDGNATFD